MATKKEPEKKPAKKKPEKVKPKPVPCTCKRLPVVSKVKGGDWICGCVNWQSCENVATSGRQPTEEKAIEAWNYVILQLKTEELKKKEAQK